jgi:hypothetical protein
MPGIFHTFQKYFKITDRIEKINPFISGTSILWLMCQVFIFIFLMFTNMKKHSYGENIYICVYVSIMDFHL